MSTWWSTFRNQGWLHDSDGRLVVAQRPNVPILVWIVARLVERVAGEGWVARAGDAIAFGALFTWAWLELTSGSARIRRILGAVVLVGIVVTRVRG